MVFITLRTMMADAADLPGAEQLWRNSFSKTEGSHVVMPTGP